MAVEDVQQLLDLLDLSPKVTELTVQGASGDKVTIKRRLTAHAAASPVSYSFNATTDQNTEEVLQPEPPAPLLSINATLVGLFHDANPPVIPGASIVVGQIVGYIESMRLMNEVVSTVEGIVDTAVTFEGQPVQYGQPIFAVAGR